MNDWTKSTWPSDPQRAARRGANMSGNILGEPLLCVWLVAGLLVNFASCVQPALEPLRPLYRTMGSRRLRQGCRATASAVPDEGEQELMAVRAPLRWIGPYPALALSFPDLATPAQLSRGEKGVSLDFVLDTGANTNTINADVASQLALTQVGSAPAGTGAGGAIGGGATFLLGNCELGDLPTEERFEFVSGLTASALPVASPAAAGVLGIALLDCFSGGVEFRWGPADSKVQKAEDVSSEPPSVTFFGDLQGTEVVRDGLCRVPMKQLPGSLLRSVSLNVNGVEIPALLDTGSPITVLNKAAAALAGIDPGSDTDPSAASRKNPFERLAEGFKAAQAAARGDVLMIAGANGPVQLVRAPPARLALGAAPLGEEVRCYVGDIPGLAALDGLGAAAGPAAVLGVDALRQRQRLLYLPSEIFL